MIRYWLTPHDLVDPEWWRPLEALAASTDARGLPPLDPDDFVYVARIERSGVPVLHAYRHVHTKKFLNIDEAGLLWKYVGKERGKDGYEFLVDPVEAFTRAEIVRGALLARHTRRGSIAAWSAAASEWSSVDRPPDPDGTEGAAEASEASDEASDDGCGDPVTSDEFGQAAEPVPV